MRNKRRIKIIIIILGIVFALLHISNFNILHVQRENDGTIENRDEVKLKNLKKSGAYSESFIHIDGSIPDNWSDTASTYDWCSGDGSWGSPYIIENVTIDAGGSPTGSGILIRNSINDYFIIRNCTSYNSGNLTTDGGIKLEYTDNGMLINNNCSNNPGSGIVLFFCDNNTISGNDVVNNLWRGMFIVGCINNTIYGNNANNNLGAGIQLNLCHNNNVFRNYASSSIQFAGMYLYGSNNNMIYENILNDNPQYGIILSGGSHTNIISGNSANENNYGIYLGGDCNDNIILGNLIKDNQNNGIYIYDSTSQDNVIYQNLLIGTGDWHARDEGTNNQWYSSGIGNYWDNHTSPDSDNNGIVDIPYTWITGSAGNVDSFPLAESPLHLGNKIHIDDSGSNAPTWSRTAELNLWCTGSGTYSDPYIIDGLEIDAGNSGSCILIENSNVYFIIRNCKVYNSGVGPYPNLDAGIKLYNTNNGTLTNNKCSNNGGCGIFLYNGCDDITISGNIANDNGYFGIYLSDNCNSNTISRNTADNNIFAGIILSYYCNNNMILENECNNLGSKVGNYYGIYLYDECDNNTISGNIIRNHHTGIYIVDGDNNTLSGNTIINNYYGIRIVGEYNIISGNNIEGNFMGIRLFKADNNIISGNTIKFSEFDGIYLGWEELSGWSCNNNNISRNTILYNGYGIVIDDECDDNLIYLNNFIGNGPTPDWGNNHWDDGYTGNYWDDYSGSDSSPKDGIGDVPYNVFGGVYDTKPLMYPPLEDTDDDGLNNLEEYTLGEDGYRTNPVDPDTDDDSFDDGDEAVYKTNPLDPLWYPMPNLKVSHFFAFFLSNDTSFTLDFSITNNGIWETEGVIIIVRCEELGLTLFNNTHSPLTLEVDETEYIAVSCPPFGQTGTFTLNVTVDPNNAINEIYSSKDGSARIDAENDNFQTADLTIVPETLNLAIISQAFSTNEFNISFFIYNDTGQYVDSATIQMWWNGTDVSTDIINIGGGLYFISLEPITVAPGEDPILLNMTISAFGYEDKYFEAYLAVEPCETSKFLQVVISDHSYSLEHFNFTFFVCNETEIGIESAIIQLWWNGTEVLGGIQNLGNGFYFVSLEPITIAPGEDSILLNMTISATNYEDKYFETYISVEPCEIVKFLQVEITENSYTIEHFNFTLFIYDDTDQYIDSATTQMWWNGNDVSVDVQNLGNGLYFISLEPITVAPGEDPILLNMTISALGYEDKYFETYISVEPCEIVKFLQVEITENSYTIEHFNFTFSIFDEAGYGIDSATIQMWWNDTDVSGNVVVLGNGLYFVSLDSITVAPGEDPILLNMVISALGYEDKLFETYLAVDPDTLEKVGELTPEFPLTLIIIVSTSIVGGIIVAGITVFLLRKRKRLNVTN